jgi:hypothetical protein
MPTSKVAAWASKRVDSEIFWEEALVALKLESSVVFVSM